MDTSTVGDLLPGQHAFLLDKGFDHGTFRSYFIQRSEKPPTLSDGRQLFPVLFHEITHFRKDTSHKDEPFKEIVLMAKGSPPKLTAIDGRYAVEV